MQTSEVAVELSAFEQLDKKSTLFKSWEKYHRDHPEVYLFFCRFAYEAMDSGKEKLSGWLIANRIRWEIRVQRLDYDVFKLKNDFIAIYTRLFLHEHPNHKAFFNIKAMKNA